MNEKTPLQGRAERLLKLLRNRMPSRHRYHWVNVTDAEPDLFKEYRELFEQLGNTEEGIDAQVERLRAKLEESANVPTMKVKLEELADQIDDRLKKARSTLDQASIKVTAGKDLEKQIEIMMKVAEDLNLINGE